MDARSLHPRLLQILLHHVLDGPHPHWLLELRDEQPVVINIRSRLQPRSQRSAGLVLQSYPSILATFSPGRAVCPLCPVLVRLGTGSKQRFTTQAQIPVETYWRCTKLCEIMATILFDRRIRLTRTVWGTQCGARGACSVTPSAATATLCQF